jgi:hypothetical protein
MGSGTGSSEIVSSMIGIEDEGPKGRLYAGFVLGWVWAIRGWFIFG